MNREKNVLVVPGETFKENDEMVPVYLNQRPYFWIPLDLYKSGRKVFYPPDWSLKDFQVGRYLGGGNYGHTYLARERKSKYVVALKIQFKRQIWKECTVSEARREMEIHSGLDHPNIIKMFGFFDDETRIVQILEYASGGELYEKLVKQKKGFPEKEAARYIFQFIKAMIYLHSVGIMHRDIKPENILLDQHNNIKLCDFGFAVRKDEKRKTYCGTPDYMSPEILLSSHYDESVDVWCLGVLAYELVAGIPPFQEKEGEMSTENKILKLKYETPPGFSKELKDFVHRILQPDPKARMKFKEALSHAWILNNVDINKENLQLNQQCKDS